MKLSIDPTLQSLRPDLISPATGKPAIDQDLTQEFVEILKSYASRHSKGGLKRASNLPHFEAPSENIQTVVRDNTQNSTRREAAPVTAKTEEKVALSSKATNSNEIPEQLPNSSANKQVSNVEEHGVNSESDNKEQSIGGDAQDKQPPAQTPDQTRLGGQAVQQILQAQQQNKPGQAEVEVEALENQAQLSEQAVLQSASNSTASNQSQVPTAQTDNTAPTTEQKQHATQNTHKAECVTQAKTGDATTQTVSDENLDSKQAAQEQSTLTDQLANRIQERVEKDCDHTKQDTANPSQNTIASAIAAASAGTSVSTTPRIQDPSPELNIKTQIEKLASSIALSSKANANGSSDSTLSRIAFGNSFKGEERLANTVAARLTTNRANINASLEKIEQALKEVNRSKDGKTISMRLDPPSLGSVKIDVSLRDGALHARIVADSPAVTQVLRERGYELQQLLRQVSDSPDEVKVSFGEGGFSTGSEFISDGSGSGGGQQEFTPSNLPFHGFVEPELAFMSNQHDRDVALDHWVA